MPWLILAASDATTAGFFGAVGGFISFLVTRVSLEFVKTYLEKSRLTNALLVDCVATLNKVEMILPTLKGNVEANPNVEGDTGSSQPRERVVMPRVRELTSGLWISPPLDCSRDLIPLLGVDAGRDIVHYFDRWNLFFTLESKYADIYSKLLNSVSADADGPPSEMSAEYWEQVVALLRFIYVTANELCGIACAIIRRLRPTCDCELEKLTDGRFKTWDELARARAEFEAVVG